VNTRGEDSYSWRVTLEDLKILEEMWKRTLEFEELEEMWLKSQIEELAVITGNWNAWIVFE